MFEFDGQPLGTDIQVVYFGDIFSVAEDGGCPMGGVVTAQYIIGAAGQLTRDQLDQIIAVLNIRDAAGQLVKPPVGDNCTYKLVLEKGRQQVPVENASS